jgi:hypothetical protein
MRGVSSRLPDTAGVADGKAGVGPAPNYFHFVMLTCVPFRGVDVGMRNARSVADRGLQHPLTVAIQRVRRRRHGGVQARNSLNRTPTELDAGWRRPRQAIAGALVADQGLEVDGLRDLLASIPTTQMAS